MEKKKLKFRYCDGGAFFKSWKDMVDFWVPYYDNRADAGAHLRRAAYGTIIQGEDWVIADCFPNFGPMTVSEKRDLMNKARNK